MIEAASSESNFFMAFSIVLKLNSSIIFSKKDCSNSARIFISKSFSKIFINLVCVLHLALEDMQQLRMDESLLFS